MKICTKCKIEQDESNFIRTSTTNPHLRSTCRKCNNKQALLWSHRNKNKKSESYRRWAKKNPEKLRLNRYDYFLRHREKNKELCRLKYNSNKEKYKLINKKWQVRNQDRVKVIKANWYQLHRNETILRTKLWKKNNPEQSRLLASRNCHVRRSRIKNTIRTLTAKQWQDILTEHDFRCAYCGIRFSQTTPPTKDHKIPVKLGGDFTYENIVPACLSCNSRKHTKIISA